MKALTLFGGLFSDEKSEEEASIGTLNSP